MESQVEEGLHNLEEPKVQKKKRRYWEKAHGLNKKLHERRIGEDRDQKVSLQSVRS
jgi:hypothetical protein